MKYSITYSIMMYYARFIYKVFKGDLFGIVYTASWSFVWFIFGCIFCIISIFMPPEGKCILYFGIGLMSVGIFFIPSSIIVFAMLQEIPTYVIKRASELLEEQKTKVSPGDKMEQNQLIAIEDLIVAYLFSREYEDLVKLRCAYWDYNKCH